MKTRIASLVLLTAVFALTSCNLGAPPPSSEADQALAATIVALTLTAAAPPVVLNSPTAPPPPATSTPEFTTFAVVDNTNCRQGPGTNYAIVTTIAGGANVQIVARSADGKYWIVAGPNNVGACWIAAEFGTAAGNTNILPIVTPVGGENKEAPAAPAFAKDNGWTFFCYGTGQTDITLKWVDKSENEAGYRIIRNGAIVAELPANSTSFAETITLLAGQGVEYQLEVFNPSGSARSSAITLKCP